MTTAATRMSTRREATLTSLVGDGRPDARTDSAASIGTRGQLLKPDQRGISPPSGRMSRSTHWRSLSIDKPDKCAEFDIRPPDRVFKNPWIPRVFKHAL